MRRATARALADVYHSREHRAWYAYAMDRNGNQIGDAAHSYTKDGAQRELAEAMLARFKSDPSLEEAEWLATAIAVGVDWNPHRDTTR